MSWPMWTFLTAAMCWCHKSKCHAWFRSLHVTGLAKSVLCFKIMTWDDDNFKTLKCGFKHGFKLCLNYATGVQSSLLPNVKRDALIHFFACFFCALFLNSIVFDSEKLSYFTPEDDIQLHVAVARCPTWGGSYYYAIPNSISLTKSRWDMTFLFVSVLSRC